MKIILFLIFALYLHYSIADPVVETNYGKTQGFSLPLDNGLEADVFLRVPFAQAPIENLRLEKPQPLKKWDGVHNSTYFSPACIQHGRKSGIMDTDEDCLYLNIISPQKKPSESYPVLFWIHASGWEVGSGVSHGYKGIAERWAPQGIIIVTINYRLGALGWMSTGTESFPGNLGFWDQLAALKFVNENIKYFGGDPNRITVWGSSAGGASASALGLSPHSRDLFQQAIQMSGSLYAEWSTTNRVVETSEKLAEELKCSNNDSNKVKECIKKKTIDEIQDAVEKLGTSRRDVNTMIYNPRIDGDFFLDSFEVLINKAPKKPTIVGFSQDEGSILTALPNEHWVLDGVMLTYEQQRNYKREDVVKFIKEVVAPEKIFGNQSKEVQKKLEDFYVNRKAPENPDYKFWVQRYCDIISNIVFNIPALNDAISKVNQSWPVYVYLSDYLNEKMLPENATVRRTPHLSEYPYLFGFSAFNQFGLNRDDLKYQKYWIEAIANFVKTGNPSTKTLKWDPFNKVKLNYMKFSLEPRMENGLKLDQLNFWNQLSHKYSFDIVRGIDKKTLSSKDLM